MRILILSNKIPYPAIDGGSIATLNLSLSLAEKDNEITVLAMNTAKHYFPLNEVPAHILKSINLKTVDVLAKIRFWGILKNFFFSKAAYAVERFHSSAFQIELMAVLKAQNFDIVQLEGLYLGMYIPTIRAHSKAKIVYRAHNLEFEIWNRAAERSRGIKKRYLKTLSTRLEKFEKECLTKYDAVLPISSKDAQWFDRQNPTLKTQIVPAGINRDFKKAEDREIAFDLFHIGALDWLPNQEGLQWFFEQVWPAIHQQHPELHFYLAGRNASKEMRNLKLPNLHFLGEIADAQEFMLSHGIMVVPLFSGSGMRIKIIEAMALGKAVVSTSLGLEGNGAKNNLEVLVADTKDEFIARINELINRPNLVQQIGKAASSYVYSTFDQNEITNKLEAFYKKLIQENE